jgi:predicted RNA-binding Zn-ribbon protein involved in translation (DUF1610 family)
VENRGFWALEAPPKCKKQRIQRGPIYRLADHWPAFERTAYIRTHQLFVVKRSACGRSQITAGAARADWACIRPLLMHATVGAFECTKCGQTHLGRNQLLHFMSTLPFASHVLMQ